jgi:hypothetical protein
VNVRDLSDEQLLALLGRGTEPKKKQLDATDQAMMDPTAGQSWGENFFAGLGKMGYDTARGLGNIVTDIAPGAAKLGFATRADTDETKKRDAALMDSSGGFWGNVAGNAALGLAGGPLTALPRAAAFGAGLGAIQPVGTQDSRMENTAMGGAFGAAIPAAVAVGRGVKSAVEPVIAPQRTAARILEQFADDPQAMRLAAQGAQPLVPGVNPTLAQVAQQPGISTLERGAMNQPGPLQAAMSARSLEQNAARVAELEDMAGRGGKLDFYKQNRETVANELYARAFAETPGDTKWIKGEVTKLMQRPAFVSALKDGQEMMLNLGGKVDPKRPEYASEILHYTKLSLDDSIERAVAQGAGNKSRAMIDTRDKLVSLMESKDFSPSYREARDTFKNMSGPINEMELAGQLRDKLVPALSDVTGQTPGRLYADSMARDLQRLAPNLAKTSPEFQGRIGNLAQDLQRKASAEGLGKATGSPTAQYLATQNLMRQVAGPLGMPEGFVEKAVSMGMNTPVVGSVARLAAKYPEQAVQRELADMLMNPATASQALALINKQPGMMQRLAGGAIPYAPALGVSGMFAANR